MNAILPISAPTKGRVSSQMVMRGDVGASYGGVTIDKPVTLTEALDLADLNWQVKLSNSVYCGDKRTKIPGARGTFRENADGTRIGLGTVGGRYTPVQNHEAFRMVENIIGKNDACVVAGGALFGGRYTFLCIDLGGMDILPNDQVRKHLLLLNSHDGSCPMLALFIPDRLVCQNMLNFSFGVQGGDPLRIKHTSSAILRLEEAREVLSMANKNFDLAGEAFERFAQVEIDDEQTAYLIYKSLGVTSKKMKAFQEGKCEQIPQWVNQAALMHEAIKCGPGSDISGVTDTLWGAFNGINYYWDNLRTVRGAKADPDVAIESKLLLHSAKAKVQAFRVCHKFLTESKN